jgi:hypothetical protein
MIITVLKMQNSKTLGKVAVLVCLGKKAFQNAPWLMETGLMITKNHKGSEGK